MNARSNLIYCALAVAATATIFACSKQDDTYKPFIEGGEIVYTAKVDSLDYAPGRNKARLNWALMTDQRVTKVKVYWNDKKDSAILPIQRGPGIDYMNVTLNNLEEKTHSFSVVTADNDGHRSMSVDVLVNVYGDIYQSTLFNRPVKSVTWRKDSTIVLWSGANSQNLRVELSYSDTLNVTRNFILPRDSTRIALPAFSKGRMFTYRTSYLPHKKSLDTFYTNPDTYLVP